MASKENTNLRDTSQSTWHRALGKRIAAIDADQLLFQHGSIEDTFMELKNNILVCAIDYKRMNSNVKDQFESDKFWTMQTQARHYDCELKRPIPFLVTLTYLDASIWPDPMYFTIPGNNQAKVIWNQYGRNFPGIWQTPLKFSQFQHNIRNIQWNPEEPIPESSIEALSLPPGARLKNLPNVHVEYPLPRLQFSKELTIYPEQE